MFPEAAGELEPFQHSETDVPLGHSRVRTADYSKDTSETTGYLSATRLGEAVCIFMSGAATATALVSAVASVRA